MELIQASKRLLKKLHDSQDEIRTSIKQLTFEKQKTLQKLETHKTTIARLDAEKGWIDSVAEQLGSMWKGPGEKTQKEIKDRAQERNNAKTQFDIEEKHAEDIEEQLNAKQEELKELEVQLHAYNGPDDVFASLRNECFESQVQQYTYKICLFKTVQQDYTNLGYLFLIRNFDSWDYQAATMSFTNGENCWHGAIRSTKVKMVCWLETQILSIEEPDKCQYEMVLGTPAVCAIHPGDFPIPKQAFVPVHDEL